METQNGDFTKDYLIFHLTITKNQLKKSLHVWLPELFSKPVFLQKQLIYDSLAGNNHFDVPHYYTTFGIQIPD